MFKFGVVLGGGGGGGADSERDGDGLGGGIGLGGAVTKRDSIIKDLSKPFFHLEYLADVEVQGEDERGELGGDGLGGGVGLGGVVGLEGGVGLGGGGDLGRAVTCLLYTSPSPRDRQKSRMPSSA